MDRLGDSSCTCSVCIEEIQVLENLSAVYNIFFLSLLNLQTKYLQIQQYVLTSLCTCNSSAQQTKQPCSSLVIRISSISIYRALF